MKNFSQAWKRIKCINIRYIAVDLIGIIMARTLFLSMNPVAVAYFAAAYLEKKNRLFLIISMVFGMAMGSVYTQQQMIKYVTILFGVWFANGIIEKRGKALTITSMGMLAGLLTFMISISYGSIRMEYSENILIGALEGLLVMACVNLFHLAINFILRGNRGQILSNEEIISIAILSSFFVYGMPQIAPYQFSVVETVAYLLILCLGYKYGAGAGAVVGTACGIVFFLLNGNVAVVGIFCILGICSGMFRELGRFAAIVVFIVLDVLLCSLYAKNYLYVSQVRALVSSGIIFLLLPRPWMFRVYLYELQSKENNFSRQNIQQLTRQRLNEFSESFQKLSKTFDALAKTRQALGRQEMDCIFDSLSNKLCSECENYEKCWSQNFYNTQQTAASILEVAKKEGFVTPEDLPEAFQERCVNFNAFVNETNRELALASMNLNWYNRMAESREAIASQLWEVSQIIDEFSKTIHETREVEEKLKDNIVRYLKSNYLEVKKISIFEKKNKKRQIFCEMRTRKGRCITSREAAAMVSKVCEKKMKPSVESKNIINKDYERIVFVEDTDFKTLTGKVRVAKDGEKVSGDNFSFLNLENGQMVMLLSDGMGTGEKACEESETVIELLEQFLEAGFQEESAIKLINASLVLNNDNQSFSTLDISRIDLFSGECNFIKIGGCATFIKRNTEIEIVECSNLPVGVFASLNLESCTKKLGDGDYIIMVSDGILDSLEEENKEEKFTAILKKIKLKNPQEMAECIMEEVMKESQGEVRDDMTVLVTGIWKKS
ncbi:stage II sporulation protein E [Anaeromicropila populeti]|uniref:Stage II sporulation protein E n=1 Tax=Anaeromicropila populeti TaxID=37658 RepID=A0A1I6IY85_9FIRM|nr:stage II sporulation protein E [Anaeromicropila populeti]SFR71706.1 stage II sporulation protein E [Anaeromicropila populeti]